MGVLGNRRFVYIGYPKSLGHFLKSHISKITMHEGKFGTYLERKISGIFFDTKFIQLKR